MRLKPAEDLKLVENSNAHNNLRSSTLTGSDGNRNNHTATDKFTTFNQSPQWSSPWSEQTATAELVANINFRVTSPSKHQHQQQQQQQQPQEQPFSPDDSLADYEEGQEESCSSCEDLSPDGECSDSEYESLPIPPRGIVNPNYPGFQHLAHRLVPPYDEDDNNNNEEGEEDYAKEIDSVNKLDSLGPTLKAVYLRPKLNIPLDSVEVDSDTDKSENCNSCAEKDFRLESRPETFCGGNSVLGKSYNRDPHKTQDSSDSSADRSYDSDTSGEELCRSEGKAGSTEKIHERESSAQEADELNSVVGKRISCNETHSKPQNCDDCVEKNNTYTEKSHNGKPGVDKPFDRDPSAYEEIPGVDKSYPSVEKAYELNPTTGKRNSCTEGDSGVDKLHNCDSSLEKRNSYTEKSYNKPHDRDSSVYEVIPGVDKSYPSVEKAYKLSSTLGKRNSFTEGYPSVVKAHTCDPKEKENNSYTEKSPNGKSGVDKPHDRDPSAYEIIPGVDKSYPSVEKAYKLNSTTGKRNSCIEGDSKPENCDPSVEESKSYTEKSYNGKSGVNKPHDRDPSSYEKIPGVDKSYPSVEKAYKLSLTLGKRGSCTQEYPSVDKVHICDPKGKENNSYTEKSHNGVDKPHDRDPSAYDLISGVDKSYPSVEKAYELNQTVGKRNSCFERSYENKEKRYSVSRKRNSYTEGSRERDTSVEDSPVEERDSWTERDLSGERGDPERGRSGKGGSGARPGPEESGRAARKPLRLELKEGKGAATVGFEKKAMAGKAVVAEVLKEAYDKSRGSDRANNNEEGECRLDNRSAADKEKKEKMQTNLSVQKSGGCQQPANHHCQVPPANMQGPAHRQRRTKRPQSDHIGGFDVYNIETAMPKIDLEAIESHLRAAREEERRSRGMLESVVRSVRTRLSGSLSVEGLKERGWRLSESIDNLRWAVVDRGGGGPRRSLSTPRLHSPAPAPAPAPAASLAWGSDETDEEDFLEEPDIVDKFVRVINPSDDPYDRPNRNRRNDREEIRRRLATGCDADEYYGGDRPGKKPSLQARLQSGMNLQICFMNDTMSDTESPCSEVAPSPPASQQQQQMMMMTVPPPLGQKKTAALHDPPRSLNLTNKSCTETCRGETEKSVGESGGGGGGGGSFLERQARLQAEARVALSQAKDLARMQMQAERQRHQTSPITDMLRASLHKVGISLPEGRRRVSRQMLTDMNVAQLQVIVNDLHTQIEQLNEGLVKYLMERDELHMSQDSMLVDIEDLTRYLGAKENLIKEEMTSQNNNVSRPRQQAPVVVSRIVGLGKK